MNGSPNESPRIPESIAALAYPRFSERPRLCLNSIVKNETANLPRMLASVAPFVTCYAILDTGSTDGTQEMIRTFFAERDIPGIVRDGTFEDYAQARNDALDVAADLTHIYKRQQREYPKPQVLSGDGLSLFDFVLLVDADMQLMVDAPDAGFPWPGSAVEMVMQRAGTVDYDNVRLLHSSLLRASRYREYTHEFLSTPIPSNKTPLAGVWFLDHGTGSNRGDKFSRDIRLLTKALKENPDNARAHFYIAESYRFNGQPTEAIHHYKRRCELGGWDEERWYARYQLARCYLAANLDKLGIATALEAYDERPARTEPLLLATEWLRTHGRNASAAMLAVEISDREKPADSLFVERSCYDGYHARSELSISGFFSPRESTRLAAKNACHDLSIDPAAPQHLRELARRNLQHYARPLPRYDEGEACARTVAIRTRVRADGWVAMNPSIVRAPDGRLLCIVRRVNYTIADDGSYRVDGGRAFTHGDEIRTENEIYELNEEALLDPARGGEATFLGVVEDRTGRETTDFYVRGFEDMRAFYRGDRLFATTTVRDMHPEGKCEIRLVEIDPATWAAIRILDLESALPEELRALQQKNWMPESRSCGGSALRVRYAIEPGRVIRVTDGGAIDFNAIEDPDPPAAADHLRGSSQIVQWTGDRRLVVTHESIDRPGQKRVYLHRFVQLEKDDTIAPYVGDAFAFDAIGIEFCAGLATSLDRRTLYLSYGSNDAEARIAVMPSWIAEI